MSTSFLNFMAQSCVLNRSLLATAVAFSGTSYVLAQTTDAETKLPEKRIVVVVDSDDDVNAAHAAEKMPKLWLGILLKEIDGDLATYLGTDDGVLVESVFPDSPAEKAGLMRGDVLQQVGGKALKGPSDLMAAIGDDDSESEPKPLKLTLKRKNEEMQLELTPTKRPGKALRKVQVTVDKNDVEGGDSEENEFTYSFSGDIPRAEMDLLLERVGKGKGHDVELFRLGSPSMIFVPDGDGEAFRGEMQVVVKKEVDGEDLEITVTRSDENPAKITVKNGDDVEKYTEEDLKEMPQKWRVIVEPILKNNGRGVNVNTWKVGPNASNVDARQLADKYREMADKVRKEAELSAEHLRAQALETVRQARVAAEARVRGGTEVSELKELVEELRAEVNELRKQLKNPE